MVKTKKREELPSIWTINGCETWERSKWVFLINKLKISIITLN